MFPSVNTDITTLGLPKNCEVATIIYKCCIFFHWNTVFVCFKKTLYKKNYINENLKEMSLGWSWSDERP